MLVHCFHKWHSLANLLVLWVIEGEGRSRGRGGCRVLLLARGPLEPRGSDVASKGPEDRKVAAAAAEHHRTDPVDAIIQTGPFAAD